MTNDTCPTCGQPVQVVSSDEGTQHYVAAEQSALLRHLHDRERTIEHLVQANHALHDELAAARAERERLRVETERLRRALEVIEAILRCDPEPYRALMAEHGLPRNVSRGDIQVLGQTGFIQSVLDMVLRGNEEAVGDA